MIQKFGVHTGLPELTLPSLPELSAFLRAEKLRLGKKRHYWYQVNESLWVSAAQLLSMLEIFRNGKAYHDGHPFSPIYFVAEDGSDGLLMPLKPPRNETSAA